MVVPFLLREAVAFSGIISMLGIGLTLTFLTTRVPNFAHGSFGTVGAYVTLTFVRIFGLNPYASIPVSILAGGVTSWVLYRAFLKPLKERGSSVVLLMIATIAFDLVMIALLNIYADYLTTLQIKSRFFLLRQFDVSLFGLSGVFYLSPALAILTILGLHLVLTRTKFGVAMRATIENENLAGVVGINTDLVYSVSWFLAGAVAGLAGMLISLFTPGHPDLGTFLLVTIFAASVTGGFFSIYGAVIGGFVVGMGEIVGLRYLTRVIGPGVIPYRPVIPLAAMMIVLLVSPRGISGVDWGRAYDFLRGIRSGSPK